MAHFAAVGAALWRGARIQQWGTAYAACEDISVLTVGWFILRMAESASTLFQITRFQITR